jgi:uncharacterized phage protein (TIGR01671 family)
MRERKFRIWYNNKMIYNPELEFTKLTGGDYIFRYMDDVGFCVATSYQEEDGLFLEDFIGQEDKNGKNIFEGDILQTDEIGWRGYCVYHYDGFMLIDDKGGFSSPSWKKCEVIGNVHENKKLLEKKKKEIKE